VGEKILGGKLKNVLANNCHDDQHKPLEIDCALARLSRLGEFNSIQQGSILQAEV